MSNDSRLQIILDALWRGDKATRQTAASLDKVAMAAAKADLRAGLLSKKMGGLRSEVAKGTITTDAAAQQYVEFDKSLPPAKKLRSEEHTSELQSH